MTNLTFLEIQNIVMQLAKEKGFGTNPEDIIVSEKIALIHTEVSEAYEAYRKKILEGKDSFSNELADVIIRTMHLSGCLGVDLEKHILEKIQINKNREWSQQDLNERLVNYQ